MTDKKVKMKLVGLNGNAFSLMSAFKHNARRQGWTREAIDSVLTECKKGDYNHLLATLMDNTESEDEDEDEDGECDTCGGHGCSSCDNNVCDICEDHKSWCDHYE